MKTFVGILLVIIGLGLFTVGFIIKPIILKQNCTGYLKRAADANTIELAKSQLSIAIKYIEDNNLTHGYTSVIYKTPDEDIAFWYNNIKTSYNELNDLSDDSSPLEKFNMLMKLRETLLDNNSEGTLLTVPDGLSRYPSNLSWGIFGWLSIIILFIGGGVIVWAIDDY